MKLVIKVCFASLLCIANTWVEAQDHVKVDENTFGDIQARQIGPAIMSGRITALDAVDHNPALVYVGAATGGLWKSKNYGTTFKPVFDKYNQSIGSIAIDQQHPDTVWVGSGEVWVRNSVSVGDGIYRTNNAGETWKRMGLEKTERIAKILVHPKNSDVVFAAALGNLWSSNTDRGLYKTADGGKTWEKVLYIDENTGCSDIAIDWNNPDIMYAGMWEFRRTPWSFSSGGKGSGLYRSSDGGKTWSKITSGMPDGMLGRISVSVSPVKSDLVYALIEAEKTGLYRSSDKGNTWKMVTQSEAVNDRPFYFSFLALDPLDTNIIYKPGFNLNKSTDGGKTFSSAAVEGGNYHGDCHPVYISKKDNSLIYMGTDGGVYYSMDKGNTWRLMRNLPVSQFYHVSCDNADPFNVYGGLQDNGSWFGPSRSSNGITNSSWKSVGFGDGFYVYCDKLDSNILYWQFQGGKIARYYQNTGQYKSLIPFKDKDSKELRFNWNAPMVFSPTSNRFYAGAQYLFKTNNRGDTWTRISPDLTTDDPKKLKQEKSGGLTVDNSSAENHCTIYTINESPLDSLIIWAGTDDGNLQVTANGGKTWTNVVGNVPGLPANTWCSYVEPGHFDKNTVYVTFDGHRLGDKTPYVFKSADLGKTWKALADTTIKAYCHVIKEDQVKSDLLFLGTEGGLYLSIDGGQNWCFFKGNVPKVPVMDIAFQQREQSLVLATHGRGIMVIDDLSPFRQVSKDVLDADVRFLQPKDFIIREGTYTQQWNGDDEYIGQVPQDAAPIVYYMKKRHIFGDIHLEIYDAGGKMIKRLPAGMRKGVNVVQWTIQMKPPKVPVSPQMEGYAFAGPNYSPGEYTVKLFRNNDVYESKIRLLPDPKSMYSIQDREVRQQAVMKAYNMLQSLAFSDRLARDVRDQSKNLSKSASKSLSKKLLTVSVRMDTLHGRIVSTKEGKITGEERLRERIAFIYGSIMQYPGRPTDAQVQGIELLEKEAAKTQDEVNTLITQELPKLNQELVKDKLAEIKLISQEDFSKEP
ncbi:MAG: glycosyl hydrolase [Bacteroidetes bacterium]|nr:glycosyl hydrolase [Bacteroidota bacterium]